MKLKTKIIFFLLGALLALFPIFSGGLSFFEKIIVSAGITFLTSVGLIMGYNFIKNAGAERDGIFTNPVVPLKQRILWAIIGAISFTILSLLLTN